MLTCFSFICFFFRTSCKNSHSVFSGNNLEVLKKQDLQDLTEKQLFQLLLQNDPWLLPEVSCPGGVPKTLRLKRDPRCFPARVPQVCSHYNRGNGLHGSCKNNASCVKLHICQHFLEEDCRFGSTCKRAHSFSCNEKPLFQYFSPENVENLSRLYRNRLIIAAQESRRDAACSGKEQSLLFKSLLQRHQGTLTHAHVCPPCSAASSGEPQSVVS